MIKKIFLCLIFSIICLSCDSSEEEKYSQIKVYRIDGTERIELSNNEGVIDFGDVDGNLDKTIDFEICNVGNSTLRISKFSSANDDDYESVDDNFTRIESGASATFGIRFSPYTVEYIEPLTTTISILSDSKDNSEFKIKCTGMKIAVDSLWVIHGVDGNYNGAYANGSTFDFGDVGVTAVIASFTIENIGDVVINISSFTITPDDNTIDYTYPDFSIDPDDKTTFQITFAPKEITEYSYTLVIENDGAINKNYTIYVTGAGK